MANVLHIGKYFPPHRGGIESATAGAVESALREDHEVQVLCFSSATSAKETVKVWRVDGRDAHIHRMPCRVVSSQPLGLAYAIKGLGMSRRVDLIHLHYPNMLGALMALFTPRHPQLLVHWHSDVVGKGMLGRAFAWVEYLMLCRADAVVCTSGNYARSSLSLRRFQHKVHVVPLGVADPRRRVENQPLNVRVAQWLRGRQMVLSVGRLVPYKGFDILIEAATHLPVNAGVVIVGEGPLSHQLAELIRHRGLSDKVLMVGGVEQATLHGLLDAASLFALASHIRSEAFGVVLAEAMAFGLPVVACDIPGSGVSWVNQDGRTGFNVPIRDARAFAGACERILSDGALRANLSTQARQRYETHLSESVSARALMDVYRHLLCHDDESEIETES